MPKPPSRTTPTNSSEDPARLEHIKGRYNLGAAVIPGVISGVFGLLVGGAGLFAAQDQGKFPIPDSQATATATVIQTVTPSATPSVGTDAEQSQVLVSAVIGPSDTLGKDKAHACVQPKNGCVWIVPGVTGPDGPMDDGCNMTWQLVTDGGLGSVIDQGRAFRCNSGFYVGNDKSMPADTYRLKLAIETDAGDKYAGQYDFTLVSE